MPRDPNANFYRRRMAEERSRAEAAEQPQLRQLHAWWAKLYEDRLHGKHVNFGEAIMEAVRMID